MNVGPTRDPPALRSRLSSRNAAVREYDRVAAGGCGGMALGVHAVTGAKGRGMGLRVGELAHLRDAVELRRTVGRLAAREVDVPLVIKREPGYHRRIHGGSSARSDWREFNL